MGGLRGPVAMEKSREGEPSRELVLDSPGELSGEGTWSSSPVKEGKGREEQENGEEKRFMMCKSGPNLIQTLLFQFEKLAKKT